MQGIYRAATEVEDDGHQPDLESACSARWQAMATPGVEPGLADNLMRELAAGCSAWNPQPGPALLVPDRLRQMLATGAPRDPRACASSPREVPEAARDPRGGVGARGPPA